MRLQVINEFKGLVFYNPQQVFALCKPFLKEDIHDYMYMHSENANVHNFKHVVFRTYKKIDIKKAN